MYHVQYNSSPTDATFGASRFIGVPKIQEKEGWPIFHRKPFHLIIYYISRIQKLLILFPRKTHARNLLLNNECLCLMVTIMSSSFFLSISIIIFTYYYYSVLCSCIISIKWFLCVNTSWPLQRLKGLFLFHLRPGYTAAHYTGGWPWTTRRQLVHFMNTVNVRI